MRLTRFAQDPALLGGDRGPRGSEWPFGRFSGRWLGVPNMREGQLARRHDGPAPRQLRLAGAALT